MARINIVNADNKIDATPQRAYFKLKQTGGPKGEKGDTGAQGPIGPQGPQGASASVSVNSTTTLPAGSSATVENIGTAQNVKLNFGIPTGAQGPQGEQGPQGAQGPQGVRGEKGAKGDNGAAATVDVNATNTGAPGTNALVENVGTNTAALLNFTIPRGEKGETGTNATIEVGTTTTLPAGDNATVQNVGSQTAAVLNFGIPQGEKGEKGDDGASFSTQVVPTLPETGEEGKLYLTPKNYTRQTATGNPIEATISDGAGTLESFQLDGDTFQQAYSGINLLNNSEYNTGSSNSVSYTRNADGTYTLDGTASAFAYFRMGYVQFDTETQVYLTGAPDGASMQTFSINLMKNGSTSGWQTDTFAEGRAYTLEANTPYYFAIVVRRNADVSGLVFKPQIELGSSGSDYQPFVGGTPSPNPTFPQPIQTVTGEQTVQIVGKNLFDGAWRSGQYNSTGEWQANEFDGNRATTDLIPVTGGDYAISLNSDTLYTSFININYFDESKNWLGNRSSLGMAAFLNTDRTKTFTLPDTAHYLAVSIRPYSGYTGDKAIQNAPSQMLQVERASAVTAYAPYHATSYPINLGKNLFNKDYPTEHYYYDASGNKVTDNRNDWINQAIPLSEKLTFSFASKTGVNCYVRLVELNGGAFVKRTLVSTTGTTVTLDASTTDVIASVDAGPTNYFTDLQIEAGSTATTYAPYFTPIELCKLGEYQDYIWKDGEDWKVHKANGEYTLTSSVDTTPQIDTSKTNTTRFQFTNILTEPSSTAGRESLKCSHFVYASNWNYDVVGIQLADYATETSNTRFWFRIPKTIATTFDGLKTWLTNNPVRLYYPLATATDTAITNSTLIAQLEAIRTAALETGTNTITNSAAGANLAGDMEIGYYSYNPRNRYDKWLWLDINNEYEQIGS